MPRRRDFFAPVSWRMLHDILTTPEVLFVLAMADSEKHSPKLGSGGCLRHGEELTFDELNFS